jgi:hypothetical protein
MSGVRKASEIGPWDKRQPKTPRAMAVRTTNVPKISTAVRETRPNTPNDLRQPAAGKYMGA